MPDEELPGAEAHAHALLLVLLVLPYLAGGMNPSLLQALPLLLPAVAGAAAVGMLYSWLRRLQTQWRPHLPAFGEINSSQPGTVLPGRTVPETEAILPPLPFNTAL